MNVNRSSASSGVAKYYYLLPILISGSKLLLSINVLTCNMCNATLNLKNGAYILQCIVYEDLL